jgi:secreted trypsin-like serine protease
LTANKLIRGPLWATLVGSLLAAIGVSFFVFVQSGEAAPQEATTDEQPPYASVTPRIVGGTEVPNGKYPFMAFIEIKLSDGSIASCGGSLIDRDSVLTAAHCIPANSTGALLTVGATDRTPGNQGQIIEASEPFIHPGFLNGQRNFSYDAAVLKLKRPVKGIEPIKLATAKQNNLETPGRKLTVAGWGTTSEGSNQLPTRMREVSVPVVSDSRAKRAYASLPPLPRFRYIEYVPSLMVAAGGKRKDHCFGDSGGPLFKPGTPSTQVGIASYALGCARAGYPGASTEVNNPEIRRFILDAARR